MDPTPSFDIAVLTDPGRKRRDDPNQDCVRAVEADLGRPPLLIAADGMGGHAGGAQASQLVVEAVAEHFRRVNDYSDLPALLQNCLLQAHKVLTEYALQHRELASMGSTAVIAVLGEGEVTMANVGDSRAYLIRAPRGQDDSPTMVQLPRRRTGFLKRVFSGGRRDRGLSRQEGEVANSGLNLGISQISFDHSVVADQVRAGLLTPMQALRSPKRNRLTQSLTPRRKEITPFVSQKPFSAEDTLLLCTDGLWGVIPEATLAAIVQELSPGEAAKKLVEQAVSYGGPDNVSVIIARRRGAANAREEDKDKTDPGL